MNRFSLRAAAAGTAAALCLSLSGCTRQPEDPAAHLLGLTAQQRMEDYEYFWTTLQDSYPCWGILARSGVEPDALYEDYRQMVAASDSDADFYSAIYSILYLMGTSGHLWLVEPEAYPDYQQSASFLRQAGRTRWAEVLDSPETAQKYEALLALSQAMGGDSDTALAAPEQAPANVTTMVLPDAGVAYAKIDSFPAEFSGDQAILEAFYRQISGCTDLILDLTDNSGGAEAYWEQLLVAPNITQTCSNENIALVRRSENNAPYLDEVFSAEDFHPISELPQLPRLNETDRALATDFVYIGHTVEPDGAAQPFAGRIWVLVDESVYSASESFAMFCQQTGFATLVGRQTGGDGIGIDPVYLQLPNSGILVQYTPLFGLNPDGSSNEEVGTTPDLVSPGQEPPLVTALRAIAAL